MYTLWFNVILGSNVIFLCFKLIVIQYNTQLQPLVLSYDPFSSWAIQCLSVQKHNWKGMGNAQLWAIQQELNFVANWGLQVHNSAPFSCNLSQPRALQLKLNMSVLQSVQYEQSSISSWRSVPEEHFLLTALLIACFRWRLSPIKQILIKSSVDRLILDYCTKNPTWHSEYSYWIPLYELKFECPPNVQVDLGAEGSIGRWNLLPHMKSNQAKATTT